MRSRWIEVSRVFAAACGSAQPPDARTPEDEDQRHSGSSRPHNTGVTSLSNTSRAHGPNARISHQNEARPSLRRQTLLYEATLSFTKGRTNGAALSQRRVERIEESLCVVITNRPEATDDGPGPGGEERARETEYPFAAHLHAHGAVARGQHDDMATEAKIRNFAAL